MMNAASIANQNTKMGPSAQTEALWEKTYTDFLSQAQKLGMGDYDSLHTLLAGIENDDPYATSPAYYLMTCRKGLWLYRQDDQFLLFGWHPNITGQILIFNPLQEQGMELLQKFMRILPVSSAGSIVARVQKHAAPDTCHQEEILDWVFPVHSISTKDVVAHKGTKFRDLRKNLYRVDKNGLSIQSLTAQTAFIDALNLITGWSSARESDEYNRDDLSDPQVYILKLMRLYPEAFEGFTTYKDGRITGLCLWEKSNRQTISSFVSVSRPDQRGLSDYVIHQMCQQLVTQGHERVCIGGSESVGLDAFKRKFNPVHSLPLQSCMAVAQEISAGQAA